ncbi:Cation efflux transmembrane protein [Gracilaria domingensis]|nr:Cation efflux transmembrane protein [Gracilaria domingensis]
MSRQYDQLSAVEAGESTALLRQTSAYTSASWSPQFHSVPDMWRHGYKSPDELDSISNAAVRHFYERQNDLLERFRQVSLCTIQPIGDADHAHETAVQRAIVASNISNAVLMACQLYAFMSSRSLALLAVFLDALLDTVSGLVILFTWYVKRRRDKHRYPVGRSRLEPLGVIGMACLMTAATLVTLEQSISALVLGESSAPLEGLTFTSASVLISALCIKGTLYIYCSRIEDMSVRALAEDHFNDCLANSVSFFTVLIAQHFLWWVDPIGGIVISCLIIRNWVRHTLGHVDQLLGKAADRDILNLITFVACNHDSSILLVDTVRAYHVGNGIYVEVDIALPAQMPLREAHDVGESLQTRIETLGEVERCFVHLDFETSHSPTTEHKEI